MNNPTGLSYNVFKTTWGWMAALASPEGLRRLTLPQPNTEDARRWQLPDCAINSPTSFEDLTRRVRAYFDGEKPSFEDALDLCAATTFQRRVWLETRLIPYGETRSYSWLAGRVGSPAGARAVGQALARNPLAIIVPCHRVIGENGALCGFAGGLNMKRRLLSLEGCYNEL